MPLFFIRERSVQSFSVVRGHVLSRVQELPSAYKFTA